ncbi:U8-agatoxin-Ao1a-like isoform X2 [Venturia canescens]|uniref:U8-agatoxin-Ao1a-like isoform X2 n=1 Tax=Venturia canescens TaxID=32260 RepID=UPI001C9BF95F|nr:U8-agatoxin-Ao1a-like isoform X2 [Venturia canescens]
MDVKFSLLSLLFVICVLVERTTAGPYFEDEDGGNGLALDSDYSDNALENLMRAAEQKRGCIRRDGNCDHRPNDCCYSSSCRCNLWGSNCRCQRMGLFQKWG